MSQWLLIEEAPKDGRLVLLVFADGLARPIIDIGRWAADHWMYRRSQSPRYDRTHPPTHWMPLPDPPLPALDGPR